MSKNKNYIKTLIIIFSFFISLSSLYTQNDSAYTYIDINQGNVDASKTLVVIIGGPKIPKPTLNNITNYISMWNIPNTNILNFTYTQDQGLLNLETDIKKAIDKIKQER